MSEWDLSIVQIETLFKLEYLKTLNDVNTSICIKENHTTKDLKRKWLKKWKQNLCEGFPYFIQDMNAVLDLDKDKDSLICDIKESKLGPPQVLPVLLESMMFEPYFPLRVKLNQGKYKTSKKYSSLKCAEDSGRTERGYNYLYECFAKDWFGEEYFKKIRGCYEGCVKELQKKTGTSKPGFRHLIYCVIAASLSTEPVDKISKILVGSEFKGIDEGQLTDVLLAYFGSGVVSVSLTARHNGLAGSLGVGNSQSLARELKEELLRSILSSLSK